MKSKLCAACKVRPVSGLDIYCRRCTSEWVAEIDKAAAMRTDAENDAMAESLFARFAANDAMGGYR